MKNNIGALIVGFIFALGLGISGMTQPHKVIGFLDILGQWDPSLMFVMMGSILIHFIFYKIVRKRPAPVFSKKWFVPENTKLTPSLIVGALIFGVGWGLAGYCPGPVLTSILPGLISGRLQPLLFFFMMICGMFIFKLLDQKLKFER